MLVSSFTAACPTLPPAWDDDSATDLARKILDQRSIESNVARSGVLRGHCRICTQLSRRSSHSATGKTLLGDPDLRIVFSHHLVLAECEPVQFTPSPSSTSGRSYIIAEAFLTL